MANFEYDTKKNFIHHDTNFVMAYVCVTTKFDYRQNKA